MQLAPPFNPSTLPLKIEYHSSTFCASRLHRMHSNKLEMRLHEDLAVKELARVYGWRSQRSLKHNGVKR